MVRVDGEVLVLAAAERRLLRSLAYNAFLPTVLAGAREERALAASVARCVVGAAETFEVVVLITVEIALRQILEVEAALLVVRAAGFC